MQHEIKLNLRTIPGAVVVGPVDPLLRHADVVGEVHVGAHELEDVREEPGDVRDVAVGVDLDEAVGRRVLDHGREVDAGEVCAPVPDEDGAHDEAAVRGPRAERLPDRLGLDAVDLRQEQARVVLLAGARAI